MPVIGTAWQPFSHQGRLHLSTGLRPAVGLQFLKLLVLPRFAGLEVGLELSPHASHFRPQETTEAPQPRQ